MHKMRTELLNDGRRVALIAGDLSTDDVRAKNLGIYFDTVRLVDEAKELAAFEAKLARSRAEAATRPTPVPKSVTKRQAFLALLTVGIREADILAIIATMPDSEREKAEIEFTYAGVFERNHPLITIIGQSKALDATQLDRLFIQASKL